MSLCENCKSLDLCTAVKNNKEACFFFSPTEKYRIENSKEYAIGYEQGRADERNRLHRKIEILEREKLNLCKGMKNRKVLTLGYCQAIADVRALLAEGINEQS